MLDLNRDHAPFWVVDVVALIGIITFVSMHLFDVGYGVGAMLVILGFGQSSRALRASGAVNMPPGAALPAGPSSGVVTAIMSLASMLRIHA